MTDVRDSSGVDDPTAESAGSLPTDAPDDGRITEIGPPERVDRERHPLATAVGVGALLLVAVIGLLGLAGLMTGEDDQGRQVAEIVLPRVAGRTLPQAQAQLEQLGLIVDVRYEPNEVAPVDIVVDQEPIAGARVEVGEQVVVVVSDGPAGVRVPVLGDVTAAEAVRLLSALGLVPAVEEVFDEQVPQGEIVGTVPAEGARAVPGEQIRVLVSKGPEPRTVPDIVGLPSGQAFVALGRSELEVGEVTRRASTEAEPGTVLATDPAPGTQAPRGFPVAVVVAAAPDDLLVPDLVGFTQASASRVASERGLEISVRAEAVTAEDRRVGRVISQSPVPNTPIGAGSTVTVTVGVVPAPTTTTTAPSGSTTTTAPDD